MIRHQNENSRRRELSEVTVSTIGRHRRLVRLALNRFPKRAVFFEQNLGAAGIFVNTIPNGKPFVGGNAFAKFDRFSNHKLNNPTN